MGSGAGVTAGSGHATGNGASGAAAGAGAGAAGGAGRASSTRALAMAASTPMTPRKSAMAVNRLLADADMLNNIVNCHASRLRGYQGPVHHTRHVMRSRRLLRMTRKSRNEGLHAVDDVAGGVPAAVPAASPSLASPPQPRAVHSLPFQLNVSRTVLRYARGDSLNGVKGKSTAVTAGS